MTREEFMQECALRLISVIPFDSISKYSSDIGNIAKSITNEICGLSQEEKDAKRIEEEKKLSRIEELKNAQKVYVLCYTKTVFVGYEYREIVNCCIKTSSSLTREQLVKRLMSESTFYDVRKNPNKIPIAEYCYLTEEQALDMISKKKSRVHKSQILDYITEDIQWFDLCEQYDLERKNFKDLL